jgi:plastocyanin
MTKRKRRWQAAPAGGLAQLLAGAMTCALAWPGLALAAAVQVQVSDAAGRPLADAVVLVEPLDTKVAVQPLASAEVAQERRQFVPTVSVITVGSKVQFPNRDSVRHHVYSFSDAKKFEIKLYVGKPEAPLSFDKAGIVVLGCNIHDQMAAWIVVSDTPWYGQSGADGRVALADVPAGRYRVRTWHPALPPGSAGLEQALTVGNTAASLQVKLAVR